MIEAPTLYPVTYEVKKVNSRLYIAEVETGKLVYTPPDFVRSRLQSRDPLRELAKAMTDRLRYDINLIADFETRHGPKAKKVKREALESASP